MNATKITEARATATSLRGEMLALPARLDQMTHGDIRAKLADFGQVLTGLVDALEEAEAEAASDKEYN